MMNLWKLLLLNLISFYPIIIFLGILGYICWIRIEGYKDQETENPDYSKQFLILQHPDEVLFQQYIKHPAGTIIIVPLPIKGEKILVGDCISLANPVNYKLKNKIIRLGTPEEIIRNPNCENKTLKWFSTVRDHMIQRYQTHMAFPYSAIVLGVTIGYKDELTPELSELIKMVGLSHIMVVSGYNFSLLNSILRRAFTSAGSFVYFLVVIFIMIAYLIICGINPPANRAVLMIFLLCVCNITGRKSISLYSLLLSYIFLIIISPSLYKDISFNLSFFATAGLLFSNSLKEITTSTWIKSLTEIFCVNIFVFPIIILYFEKFYIGGLLINLLVLDLIPVITILGFINIVLLDRVTYLLLLGLVSSVLGVISYGAHSISDLPYLILSYKISNDFAVIYYLILLQLFLLIYLAKWRFRVHSLS